MPVLTDDGLEGRHVDLRPFIVYGRDMYVLPGGLTRVALEEGFAGREFIARRRQQGYVGGVVRGASERGATEPEVSSSRLSLLAAQAPR